MESGAKLLVPQYIATVRVAKERPKKNKQMSYWCTEENWTSMKRDLVNSWYPYLRGQRGEACLELGLDPVPKKHYSMFYRGLEGSRSHIRMPSI